MPGRARPARTGRSAGSRIDDLVLVDLLEEHVGGDLQERGAGPAVEREAEGLPHELRDAAGFLDGRGELRDRAHDLDLGAELEPTPAQRVDERRTRCVPMASSGTPSTHAHITPGTMFATPGPAAPIATVMRPELRAHASAMCTAALS